MPLHLHFTTQDTLGIHLPKVTLVDNAVPPIYLSMDYVPSSSFHVSLIEEKLTIQCLATEGRKTEEGNNIKDYIKDVHSIILAWSFSVRSSSLVYILYHFPYSLPCTLT